MNLCIMTKKEPRRVLLKNGPGETRTLTPRGARS